MTLEEAKKCKYILLEDYGSEGLVPEGFDDEEEAIDFLSKSTQECIIVKTMKLTLQDNN